jgi:nucleoside-diphosphate-sugar epimerase
MKVLVMGGTQFNGLAVVRELIRTGHDVTILNRGKTEAPIPRGVHRLYADRTDHDAMRKVLGGLEFDCIQDISAYKLEDVKLMTELFRGRVGHYIFASSTVIYEPSNLLPITEDHPVDRGDRQNEYGMSKILCEDYLIKEHRENGFPVTIAAFSMVFGPRNIIPDREQRMFMRILKGRKVMIPGDGTTVGQVGHVDDEARAMRMLMLKPQTYGKRYNVTGGDYYTDEGYVDTFASILERDVEKVFIPRDLMDDLYAGKVKLGGGNMKALNNTRTRHDARWNALFQVSRLIQRLAPNLHHWNRSVFFGIERLKQDTGWLPEYTFRGAVEQTWDWMQAEGLDKSLDFDFGFEDDLLAGIERRAGGVA